MSLRRPLVLIAVVAMLALVLGCSGGNSTNPVTPGGSANSMDSLPIIGLTDANGVFDAIGVLGFYELDLNPETMTADLTAPRMASVGESFVVSAGGFFTVTPCPDCLDVKSLEIMDDGAIKVTWNISHPFPYGDDTLPPKANNRRDLDLFDLAMVIAPTVETATTFSTGSAFTQICADPDGYTAELATVADAPTAACPYFLVIDESATPGSVTNNRFLMGAKDLEFDTLFNAGGKFKVYMTCGYGAAAKKATFLTPTYFIPEFNRKAAWKVVVTPPNGNDPASSMNTWNNTNNVPGTDEHLVKVEVYDWQQNSPIFSGDPTAYGTDAAVNEIYAASAVSMVTLEIPGMFTSPGYKMMTTADSGTGAPGDPLVFNFNVLNESLVPVGVYPSLVKVTDSRPGQDPLGGVEKRDWVIDSPDGITLNHSALSEFATYQVFDAAVVQYCGPITGSITTPSPLTGVRNGGRAMVSALATSTNGGAPITLYEWDMDYGDGSGGFTVTHTGQTANLGPYDNLSCGTPQYAPLTYTAAVRAYDSCVPPNRVLLGTIDIVVDDCSTSPILPITFLPKDPADTYFDISVSEAGPVMILADHPATGNVGGDGDTGTRTGLMFDNNLGSMQVLNPGTGIAVGASGAWPWTYEMNRIDLGTSGTGFYNNVGGIANVYWNISGTTATTPICCYVLHMGCYGGYPGPIEDVSGWKDAPAKAYDGFASFGSTEQGCTPYQISMSWAENGSDYDDYNSTAGGAYWYESGLNPGHTSANCIPGTNNMVVFYASTTYASLDIAGTLFGMGYNMDKVATTGSVGLGDGQFTNGLDVAVDSLGNILTLEDNGGGLFRFQKFLPDLSWSYSCEWIEATTPLRMDFDFTDDNLYLLCAEGAYICSVE
jgi:hypothetical protein